MEDGAVIESPPRDLTMRPYQLAAYTEAILDNDLFDYLVTTDWANFNHSTAAGSDYGNFPHNIARIHWVKYYDPSDFYSGSNGYQPEHDPAQYYCREQRCPNCTTSQSSNCAKQHWRFLVELTNGKFVFLRAHYLTDVKSDGWVAMTIADNPADLIAAMTSAEYANYTTFTIAELATYCQLG